VKWAQWDKTQSRELLGPFTCVCALHCVQLLHTILHRRDLIIFPLALHTITIAAMMSIWGKEGRPPVQHASVHVAKWDHVCPLSVTLHAYFFCYTHAACLTALHDMLFHCMSTNRSRLTAGHYCSIALTIYSLHCCTFGWPSRSKVVWS